MELRTIGTRHRIGHAKIHAGGTRVEIRGGSDRGLSLDAIPVQRSSSAIVGFKSAIYSSLSEHRGNLQNLIEWNGRRVIGRGHSRTVKHAAQVGPCAVVRRTLGLIKIGAGGAPTHLFARCDGQREGCGNRRARTGADHFGVAGADPELIGDVSKTAARKIEAHPGDGADIEGAVSHIRSRGRRIRSGGGINPKADGVVGTRSVEVNFQHGEMRAGIIHPGFPDETGSRRSAASSGD